MTYSLSVSFLINMILRKAHGCLTSLINNPDKNTLPLSFRGFCQLMLVYSTAP